MVSHSPFCPRLLVCLGSSVGPSFMRFVHFHAGHPCSSPTVSFPQCSSSAAVVFDRPTGRVVRFFVSCQLVVPHDSVSPPPQPPVPPAPVPPPDNEPLADWLSHGPLSRFPSLYGWGRGDPTPPGSGTQSWLSCLLISLGLALAGSRFLLSNLSSGLPTHSPSSVHTPITSTRWIVANLQLLSCSHGKADTWTLLHRRLSPLPTSCP